MRFFAFTKYIAINAPPATITVERTMIITTRPVLEPASALCSPVEESVLGLSVSFGLSPLSGVLPGVSPLSGVFGVLG